MAVSTFVAASPEPDLPVDAVLVALCPPQISGNKCIYVQILQDVEYGMSNITAD